ncbi:hypothetical protein MKY88_24405 [Lysinibacillus sp. FSL R7-0073]|uniref:Uncharacterized protein n=1 Tax=Lysinibacillus fusiformis TaxID=28031 RepID=A0A1E4QYG2_9BACI|nr:hypothetical protein [Lysinibacillus fusiformis]MBD8523916.1 hypothetical protein [Lysinibacillus fusiformis]MCR8854881.1 hypothetical protein [Lysinibacillus fusiformis]MED4889004.1 hypothetical protein [Lysinibacillus fusiformis]ODV53228.1 hypothetical protein BG258_23280 [Lysinibacillus fusiformis]WKT77136.1 hypothetical protein QYY55_24665 [Lysinibacillus fusiformis]
MAILKWWNGEEWLNVSYERLDRRLNLADLTDVAKARENLELVGNVDTHHHDERYYTKEELKDPSKAPDIIIQPEVIEQNPLNRFVTDEQIDYWNHKIDHATVSTSQPVVDKKGGDLYNGFIWYNPSDDNTRIFIDGEFRDVGAGKVSFGYGSFVGNGNEAIVAHGLGISPIGISALPTSNPNGFLGETWVRADNKNIYVGNTGSYTGQFRFSIVYTT